MPFGGGDPQAWEVGEVIGKGWESVKRDWAVLVFAPLLAGFIGNIPSTALQGMVAAGVLQEGTTEYFAVYVPVNLIGFVISTFFLAGQLKIFCAVARGLPGNFGDLFAGGSSFFPLLASQFLVGLAIGFGTLALIVPGVILACGLVFSQYYVVDAGMGPIEAMKESWRATTGHKASIFLLGLASIAVVMVGLLACCVGALVALPVCWMALTIVYLRISGRGPAATAVGYGAAGPAAPPGWGPPPGNAPGAPPGWGPPAGGPPPGGGWGA
jgi:uncharacterized membrane protein